MRSHASRRYYLDLARIPLGFAAVACLLAVVFSTSDRRWPIGKVIGTYLGMAFVAWVMLALFGRWATTRARGALLGLIGGTLLGLYLNAVFLAAAFPPGLGGLKLAFYALCIGCFPGAYVGALFWTAPKPD